jgi:PhnB protein
MRAENGKRAAGSCSIVAAALGTHCCNHGRVQCSRCSQFTAGKETIMATKSIPDGYHTVTPYLIVKGAAAAIEFYKRVFGATELMRMPSPDGRIGHAEIKIGDSAIMLADEHPEMGYLSPQSLGGTAVSMMVYVDRVDDVFKRAVETGAKEMRPVEDQFYGDRSGTLQDPYGHTWTIATHMEDIAPEEMRKRAEKFMQKQKANA